MDFTNICFTSSICPTTGYLLLHFYCGFHACDMGFANMFHYTHRFTVSHYLGFIKVQETPSKLDVLPRALTVPIMTKVMLTRNIMTYKKLLTFLPSEFLARFTELED